MTTLMRHDYVGQTGYLCRFVSRTALAHWLQIVLVLACLTPFAGSIFDHHYAERQPYHAHLYFGRVEAQHQHEQYTHSHNHDPEANDIFLAEVVVSTLATDNWVPNLIVSPALLDSSLAMLLPPQPDAYDRLLVEALRLVDPVFLPPLDHPPTS